jgi:hypothetical protein
MLFGERIGEAIPEIEPDARAEPLSEGEAGGERSARSRAFERRNIDAQHGKEIVEDFHSLRPPALVQAAGKDRPRFDIVGADAASSAAVQAGPSGSSNKMAMMAELSTTILDQVRSVRTCVHQGAKEVRQGGVRRAPAKSSRGGR